MYGNKNITLQKHARDNFSFFPLLSVRAYLQNLWNGGVMRIRDPTPEKIKTPELYINGGGRPRNG